MRTRIFILTANKLFHVSSKSHEEIGYGLDLNLLITHTNHVFHVIGEVG